MTSNSDFTSKYEQERLRAAEQSQVVYLQGQIDELRRLIKDQTNKYNWAMEQVRKVEATAAQFDGIFDRHRQEITQSLEGYRRDITALRREVANALVKAEESVKPIRDIQTQIHQLGESRKQDRDQTATWLVRIEDLEQRTMGWLSQIRDVDERYRSLFSHLDGLYGADEAVRNDVRKISEDIQIERQNLRRQAVEAQQLVNDVHQILDDHHSRLVRLDEIRQHIDMFAEQLPGQVTELRTQIGTFNGDIQRVERALTERFLMNQERLEEIRHVNDERLVALQEVDDQHMRQLTGWIERVDGLVRELEQRLSRATARIESSQRDHAAQLIVLEHRDVQVVEALSRTVHEQLERIKADQIERGLQLDNKE